MQIYELNKDKVLEVSGSFEYIGEIDGKVYVKGENLSEPFIPSILPQSLLTRTIAEQESARKEKEQAFNAKCDEQLRYFESDALGESYIYDMNIEDQLNLMGLVLSKSDGFVRARKGSESKANYPHTKVQISQLYADALAKKNNVLLQCGVLKSHLQILDSCEAINALAWEDYEEIKEIKSK